MFCANCGCPVAWSKRKHTQCRRIVLWTRYVTQRRIHKILFSGTADSDKRPQYCSRLRQVKPATDSIRAGQPAWRTQQQARWEPCFRKWCVASICVLSNCLGSDMVRPKAETLIKAATYKLYWGFENAVWSEAPKVLWLRRITPVTAKNLGVSILLWQPSHGASMSQLLYLAQQIGSCRNLFLLSLACLAPCLPWYAWIIYNARDESPAS